MNTEVIRGMGEPQTAEKQRSAGASPSRIPASRIAVHNRSGF